jgi:hypothetical protein
LKWWFSNHSRETSNGDNQRKILNLDRKKRKKLQLWQAYSRLYYDDKVKASVESLWPGRRAILLEGIVAGDNVKEPPAAAPLWFRTEVTKAMFEEESDEVKDKVKRHRNDEEGQDDDDDDDEGIPSDDEDQDHAQRKAKAWAYHRSVLNFNLFSTRSLPFALVPKPLSHKL